MKNVANKNGIKIYIIQNVDRQIPLETIARGKQLAMGDLLGEMETIVSSGTKLNIDYCIDEYVDANDQDDVYDYFLNSDTDNVEHAVKEFEEYGLNTEQLQLMKIKFMSEYAN
jgi:ATP-dependent DNA helicase RecQ